MSENECEYLAGCIFFNDKMSDMPACAEQYKSRYCKGNNSDCARYRVLKALGREKVPPYLFPNQSEMAEKVIATG